MANTSGIEAETVLSEAIGWPFLLSVVAVLLCSLVAVLVNPPFLLLVVRAFQFHRNLKVLLGSLCLSCIAFALTIGYYAASLLGHLWIWDAPEAVLSTRGRCMLFPTGPFGILVFPVKLLLWAVAGERLLSTRRAASYDQKRNATFGYVSVTLCFLFGLLITGAIAADVEYSGGAQDGVPFCLPAMVGCLVFDSTRTAAKSASLREAYRVVKSLSGVTQAELLVHRWPGDGGGFRPGPLSLRPAAEQETPSPVRYQSSADDAGGAHAVPPKRSHHKDADCFGHLPCDHVAAGRHWERTVDKSHCGE